MRLESWYVPDGGRPGWFRLRLVNAGPEALEEFRLGFQSVVQLTPTDPGTMLVERLSGHHIVVPAMPRTLAPGAVWELGLLACGHRPGHANDGPVGGYLVLADGSIRTVRTPPTGRVAVAAEPAPAVGLPPLAADAGDAVRAAFDVAAGCVGRVVGRANIAVAAAGQPPLRVDVDQALAADEFVVEERGSETAVRVASLATLPRALLAIARAHAERRAVVGRQRPRWSWRGLHTDLARQFFPSDDVLHLIDVAAWHGLNRLHLHLTDDEGWRVPVSGYPALTDIGGFRGPGRPIPPLLGSGGEAYGGSYTPEQIGTWVRRGAELGVELVPEIDLPAHSFAACRSVPGLRDAGHESSAASVQHFTDNVLDPGAPGTWPFLEAVFGSVADLFPAPWIHVGGDEVPPGAWSESAAARSWAAERAVTGTEGIAAAFMADIVNLARTATGGRRVGVWQEAAACGALVPGEDYVVAWRSAADARRLAADGHAVVASPAEVLYLDMAASNDWFEPGASWAGATDEAAIDAFDPTAGWTDAELVNLFGLQAALWTEHVPDRPTLERMLHPRLAAIARLAWDQDPS